MHESDRIYKGCYLILESSDIGQIFHYDVSISEMPSLNIFYFKGTTLYSNKSTLDKSERNLPTALSSFNHAFLNN